MSTQGHKPTRDHVAGQIPKVKAKNLRCNDFRHLSPDADVFMWFEPDDTCSNLNVASPASVVFACSNYGFFSFEVQFRLEAKRDVIGFTAPTEGSILVPAPTGDQDYNFNWDFSTATPKIGGRKDDCVITWSLEDGTASHCAVTLVNIVTA